MLYITSMLLQVIYMYAQKIYGACPKEINDTLAI